MPEDWRSIARKYRRHAEHLRYVVELIEDARLREQLLSITRQHDAAAGSIEQELRLQAVGGEAVRMQPNLRTPASLALRRAAPAISSYSRATLSRCSRSAGSKADLQPLPYRRKKDKPVWRILKT